MRQLTKAQFDALRKKLKKEGQLTASGILNEARKESSPLHGLFEWDDSNAAEQFRLIQSRNIIKRYNVSIEDVGEQIIHVPNIKRGEGKYQEQSVVVKNISDLEMAMSEALAKLQAAENAVNSLIAIAREEAEDQVGILAIAMKSISTAKTALNKLH